MFIWYFIEHLSVFYYFQKAAFVYLKLKKALKSKKNHHLFFLGKKHIQSNTKLSDRQVSVRGIFMTWSILPSLWCPVLISLFYSYRERLMQTGWLFQCVLFVDCWRSASSHHLHQYRHSITHLPHSLSSSPFPLSSALSLHQSPSILTRSPYPLVLSPPFPLFHLMTWMKENLVTRQNHWLKHCFLICKFRAGLTPD